MYKIYSSETLYIPYKQEVYNFIPYTQEVYNVHTLY